MRTHPFLVHLRVYFRQLYGEHTGGRGRFAHTRKKGPGRRHGGVEYPPGTKLHRKFMQNRETE